MEGGAASSLSDESLLDTAVQLIDGYEKFVLVGGKGSAYEREEFYRLVSGLSTTATSTSDAGKSTTATTPLSAAATAAHLQRTITSNRQQIEVATQECRQLEGQVEECYRHASLQDLVEALKSLSDVAARLEVSLDALQQPTSSRGPM